MCSRCADSNPTLNVAPSRGFEGIELRNLLRVKFKKFRVVCWLSALIER